MSKPRHCSTGYYAPIGGTCTSARLVCISGCDHQSARESNFLDSMSVGLRRTQREFSFSGVATLVMKVCIGRVGQHPSMSLVNVSHPGDFQRWPHGDPILLFSHPNSVADVLPSAHVGDSPARL